MTAIWDEAFLKQRERDAHADALAAQSDSDWETAEMLLERAMSDSVGGCLDCPLQACRFELRCAGNRPICMPRCAVDLVPGAEQELVDQFYAEIQQERRDAAAEGRAPDVERVMTHRVHREKVADERASTPARHGPEGKNCAAPEAPRSEVAPSQPPPQPQPPKQEPVAAPPLLALAANAQPAAPPPPDPWEPTISPEVEERINRIWADYVAGKAVPRPEPRIRSLSDDRPWTTPPWWQGPR